MIEVITSYFKRIKSKFKVFTESYNNLKYDLNCKKGSTIRQGKDEFLQIGLP